MTTELRSNHGSKRLMGPSSDYTLMDRRRLLYQRMHALEGMVGAYGMEVERRVGPSEGDWDYDATCEDPYDGSCTSSVRLNTRGLLGDRRKGKKA